MNTKIQNKLSPIGTDPYRNHFEHLTDELRWLNRIILMQVLRLRQRHFYEKLSDFRDLFISDEEINALLAAGVFENDNTAAADEDCLRQINTLLSQTEVIRQKISQRITASLNQNIFLPLIQLQRVFGLSAFEMQSVIICLAPQIDTRYEKLYAYLQNDLTKKLPSVNFILNLIFFCFDEKLNARKYFSQYSSLFKFKIIEIIESDHERNSALISKSIKLNDRITGYILGNSYIDEVLQSVAELHYPSVELSSLILPEILKEKIFQLINWYRDDHNKSNLNTVFSFYGPYGSGKKTVASVFCREIGLPLLIIDLQPVSDLELEFEKILNSAFRESLLIPAALYLKNVHILFDEDRQLRCLKNLFLKKLNESSWISIIATDKLLDIQNQLSNQRYIQVKFPNYDYQKRKDIWRSLINGRGEFNESEINALSNKFNFTPGQIHDSIIYANNNALLRFPNNVKIQAKDLNEGCRAQSNQNLKTLSQKINPQYTWKDIILPNDQMEQLREITNYVKYKHIVYDDWGFNRKLSSGKGLNVLFSGLSGTGKTMAAEIIAHELEMDLYKIDLATVVSKYIGETEKNLSRIFVEAETSNAILFFDESDALFGKRSEVKDAHDRYANIEISYLLQKMDEYTGLVILATNLRHNMDEAFVRRMHFTIEFPFPEENYRFRIWQNIIPKETPIEEEIDFKFLSRNFKISGGNIKNIALAAAFFAAADGRTITMKHFILATRRELQKMGKLCVKTDFEKYYELIVN